MLNWKRHAKINIKVLVILIFIVVALGAALFTARQIRRSFVSKIALQTGLEAYENENWRAAYQNFQEYLGRNPNDIEILKKYAKAGLSIHPINFTIINRVIASYRLIMRLDPQEEIAYEKLAILYNRTNNFEELEYIANKRIDEEPNDIKAPLWLAEALIKQDIEDKQREAEELLIKYIDNFNKNLPDKQPEYVKACKLFSEVTLDLYEDSDTQTKDIARQKALGYLTDAIEYDPNSVEALASRAEFHRLIAYQTGTSNEDKQERLKLAKEDLESINTLDTKDPEILLQLVAEWMAQGNLEQAAIKLDAADALPQEKLIEAFIDLNQWAIIKFLMASEIAITQSDKTKCVSLADEALAMHEDVRHRTRILPPAIRLYVTAEKVSEANNCLTELIDIIYTQKGQLDSEQSMPYLKSLVAKAKGDWYTVIDTLRPTIMSDAMRPELWRLRAEAFTRTDQPRRAINALTEYLRLRPQDSQMIQQLSREYLKLQDWTNAFKSAQVAESLNPTEIILKLLRIEASINVIAEEQDREIDKHQVLADEIKELGDLREKDPNNIDIRILQAMIANFLDDPIAAADELNEAIDEFEDSLRAEIQLTRLYYQNKRITEAISTCESACKNHPELAEPWLTLSGIYIAIKDYESARNILNDAQDHVIDKWEKRSISISHALLELVHGNRDEGIDILNQIAAQDKREFRARTLLLETREIQENPTKAQELINELREIEGESGLMWRLYQAAMWLSSDKWRSEQQDIESHLQHCIDSDPQWSHPPLLLGAMYEKLQDTTHAENIYRQALIRNPLATDIVDKLVTLLEEQGRFSDAEKILQESEANPQFSKARSIISHLRAEQIDKAIQELQIRVSNDAQDANSRILLARLIYWNDKDAKTALGYLDEAEAISSGSLALTAARVAILRADGQVEKAQKLLNDYVAKNNDFGAHMMNAAYFANEGDFERAEQSYRKLTEFEDQKAIGYELLSNFYGRNQKIDKAIEALEEGLQKCPGNLRLKRRLMKTLFLPGPTYNKQKALEILDDLQDRLPHDPELMKFQALEILEESTPQALEEAKTKLENVIKLEPTAVDAHLVLIGIAMQKQDYQTARDTAIRAIGSNPDNLSLLAARSSAELALANTQMAIELSRVVIQKDPNNNEARNVFVTAALLSENIRYIEEAIPSQEAYCQTKEGSSNINAIIMLTDLYRISNDMEKAKQWIEHAEKIAPDNQVVIHGRFLWLAAQNKLEEIMDICPAYLTAKNKNPKILLSAAAILVGLDSAELKEEGLKLYEHASEISPTLITERLNVAARLYQKGDAERAEQIYRQLLELHPNNIRILNDLAWILQEHYHRYNDALDMVNKALSISPDNLNVLDTKGTILSNLPGRLEDARKNFVRLIELSLSNNNQRARALLKLGRICIKLNEIENAKLHFEKALEIDRIIDAEVFTTDEQSEMTRILQGS